MHQQTIESNILQLKLKTAETDNQKEKQTLHGQVLQLEGECAGLAINLVMHQTVQVLTDENASFKQKTIDLQESLQQKTRQMLKLQTLYNKMKQRYESTLEQPKNAYTFSFNKRQA